MAGFAARESGDDTISDLWFAPDFEGRGIGSALLAAAERTVAERGYATVEIEVLTANSRALSLYRHLGYKTVWRGTRSDPFLCVELHKTLLRKSVVNEI